VREQSAEFRLQLHPEVSFRTAMKRASPRSEFPNSHETVKRQTTPKMAMQRSGCTRVEIPVNDIMGISPSPSQ
jgi:hypothetical protein